METQEFQKRAGECLDRVADWLESFDPDELDYATMDGVVTLVFSDGRRFVLNRQTAAHQIWFAAGARAWHFNYDTGREAWIDDKEGVELFARISLVVSEKLGRKVAPLID
jgi:CyaY protein